MWAPQTAGFKLLALLFKYQRGRPLIPIDTQSTSNVTLDSLIKHDIGPCAALTDQVLSVPEGPLVCSNVILLLLPLFTKQVTGADMFGSASLRWGRVTRNRPGLLPRTLPNTLYMHILTKWNNLMEKATDLSGIRSNLVCEEKHGCVLKVSWTWSLKLSG